MVYNMPIWLRKFTFNILKDHYTPSEPSPVPTKIPDQVIKVPDYVTNQIPRASTK